MTDRYERGWTPSLDKMTDEVEGRGPLGGRMPTAQEFLDRDCDSCTMEMQYLCEWRSGDVCPCK